MCIAAVHVEKARELLGVELAALVGESYERAYGDMVRVQQLTELEEVISFSNALSLSNGDPFVAGEGYMAEILAFNQNPSFFGSSPMRCTM